MTCRDCIHFEVCFVRLFAAPKQRMVDIITNPFGVTTKLLCTDCYKDENGTVCARFVNKADVQEVKHGKWIKLYGFDLLTCSVCEHYWINPDDKYDFNYCPHCGARMDGDVRDL